MYIRASHIRQLIAWAAADEEVCGILVGQPVPDAVVSDIVLAQNVHPVPQFQFLIDAATLLRVDEQARAAGHAIVGFFHSHPMSDALPSTADRRDAWPGYVYVIIAHTAHRAYLCAWTLDENGVVHPEPIVATE
jgi:proteasome lid subunit RPN8/RPN11